MDNLVRRTSSSSHFIIRTGEQCASKVVPKTYTEERVIKVERPQSALYVSNEHHDRNNITFKDKIELKRRISLEKPKNTVINISPRRNYSPRDPVKHPLEENTVHSNHTHYNNSSNRQVTQSNDNKTLQNSPKKRHSQQPLLPPNRSLHNNGDQQRDPYNCTNTKGRPSESVNRSSDHQGVGYPQDISTTHSKRLAQQETPKENIQQVSLQKVIVDSKYINVSNVEDNHPLANRSYSIPNVADSALISKPQPLERTKNSPEIRDRLLTNIETNSDTSTNATKDKITRKSRSSPLPPKKHSKSRSQGNIEGKQHLLNQENLLDNYNTIPTSRKAVSNDDLSRSSPVHLGRSPNSSSNLSLSPASTPTSSPRGSELLTGLDGDAKLVSKTDFAF